MFNKIKNAIKLFKSVDLEQLEKISKKIDLAEVLGSVSKMDKNQLKMAMKMLTGSKKKREAPPINADFYDVSAKLSEEDRALQMKVRQFWKLKSNPLSTDIGYMMNFHSKLYRSWQNLMSADMCMKVMAVPGVLRSWMASLQVNLVAWIHP